VTLGPLSSSDPSPVLLGRRSECRVLDELVASMRAGKSQVLIVRGAPGIGKTALLEYVEQRASECRIARAMGVESEMELACGGLNQLCGSMLDHLDRLPEPQRDALETAFGRRKTGAQADPFLIGLAVLSLLAEVADERPHGGFARSRWRPAPTACC
jgi:hypothetical protein